MRDDARERRLFGMLRAAVDAGRVTEAQYAAILELAVDDAVIDDEERALLTQFLDLIADRSIARVP
jgi:hypothetical protein